MGGRGEGIYRQFDSLPIANVFLFFFSDQLNKSFVGDLINSIESPPDGVGDEVLDSFVPLILAFNQHFLGKCLPSPKNCVILPAFFQFYMFMFCFHQSFLNFGLQLSSD